MARKSISGNEKLAKQIKDRRAELHLTIEEAASRAGVGTKTWSRYEAGESIRMDKCKGICKALNWRSLPDDQYETSSSLIEGFKGHKAWSQFLVENYGLRAAVSFAAGSDILLDNIKQDMDELASMPAGTHIGQLSISLLRDSLPPQFLMRYDYEFLYQMKCQLIIMRCIAGAGNSLIAHSVMEELLIYLCNEEAKAFIELSGADHEFDEYEEDWVFDLFDDMDIETCLYSDLYLDEENSYHFVHWHERQFFTD